MQAYVDAQSGMLVYIPTAEDLLTERVSRLETLCDKLCRVLKDHGIDPEEVK